MSRRALAVMALGAAMLLLAGCERYAAPAPKDSSAADAAAQPAGATGARSVADPTGGQVPPMQGAVNEDNTK